MTPVLTLVAALMLAAGGVLAVLATALGQPWAGLNLEASEDGGVLIRSSDPYGPNGAIPPGSRLGKLAADPEAEGIMPIATDVVEEPDTFETFAEMEHFFARQARLHALMSGETVHADIATPDETFPDVALNVSPRRAPVDLPRVFWAQLLVGVTALMIGAWVVSLRRQNVAAWLFATAGAGLFMSALPAAIYSTRELALDGGLFRLLSGLNLAGALTFGAGMIGLFLCYPRRLVRGAVLLTPFVIFGGWVLADSLRLLPGPPSSRHLPTALEMATITVLIAVQFRATRGDPRDRAALRALGLSVLVGAGGFVLTIIVPPLFGATAVLSQGYAFLFFLLIYVGVAFGVLRYRLFDLDEWAFRILYYMVGIFLIALLDATLVLVMSVEKVAAFSVSFILVALLYLPFRDMLWRRAFVGKAVDRERLFAQIVDIALTPPGRSQETRWRDMLAELFDPLNMDAAATGATPGITADGLSLVAPGVGGLAALRLDYAQHGRRLFGSRDEARVEELAAMLRHAIESRQAYERGVAEERARIASDMHDNIGAQLLSALHSREPERKNALVRESLSDLRDIVNDAASPGHSFEENLADLRAETAERLSGAGVDLEWCDAGAADVSLEPGHMHALRSVLREAVSNVVRHAGATRVGIDIARQDNWLTVRVADDGKGYDPVRAQAGNGIANMRARIKRLDGTLEIAPLDKGTALCARFRLDTARAGR